MRRVIGLVALVTLVFNGLSQTDGNELFRNDIVHEIRITNADISTLESGSKTYQVLPVEIDGVFMDSVGVKDKGNLSFYPDKPPLKIKTNKYRSGQEYDGIKEFTLHNSYQDPTLMREKLTYELAEKLGLYSLRTAYAEVYINDTYYGLYILIEGKDEMYKQRFDKRGSDAIESLDFGNMCFISDNPDDYNEEVSGLPYYQLDNGDETTAWPLFSEMIDAANNTASSNYYGTVNEFLNLPHFARYQALNVYLMNFDSYIGFNGNQIYMYDEMQNRWQVIPWDFNASLNLWDNGNGDELASDYPMFPSSISNGCIAEEIDNVSELRTEYLDAMCEFTHIHCAPSVINARIDELKNLISTSVYNDTRKQYTNADWDVTTETGTHTLSGNQFEGLKTFFLDRFTKINQSLVTEGFDCSTASVDGLEANELVLFPNPAKGFFEISNSESIDEVTIYSLTGQRVMAITNVAGRIELSNVAPGTYIVEVKSRGMILRNRLEVL